VTEIMPKVGDLVVAGHGDLVRTNTVCTVSTVSRMKDHAAGWIVETVLDDGSAGPTVMVRHQLQAWDATG